MKRKSLRTRRWARAAASRYRCNGPSRRGTCVRISAMAAPSRWWSKRRRRANLAPEAWRSRRRLHLHPHRCLQGPELNRGLLEQRNGRPREPISAATTFGPKSSTLAPVRWSRRASMSSCVQSRLAWSHHLLRRLQQSPTPAKRRPLPRLHPPSQPRQPPPGPHPPRRPQQLRLHPLQPRHLALRQAWQDPGARRALRPNSAGDRREDGREAKAGDRKASIRP